MAVRTRWRVAWDTRGLSFRTRETVPMPTPASRATSMIVGIRCSPVYLHNVPDRHRPRAVVWHATCTVWPTLYKWKSVQYLWKYFQRIHLPHRGRDSYDAEACRVLVRP